MSEELKEIRASEVAQHKDKKSTWIIIHDNIYDVTEFLDEVTKYPLLLVMLMTS